MDVKTPPSLLKQPSVWLGRIRAAGEAALRKTRDMPPRTRRVVFAWAAAVFALALFLTWSFWPRAIEVDVASIDRGAVVSDVIDEGRTRIHDVFRVHAPVAGRLQRVEAEAGDIVRRVQVIAVIEPAPPALLDARLAAEAAAGVAAARAALSGAQARLDLAQTDQARVALLARRDFASPAALEAANAALRAARADVAAARADLARAQASASGRIVRAERPTEVVSPAGGRVLRVIEESETIVGAGAAIMEIGDTRDLEIIAEFLSQDAVSMRPGMHALIENWGGEGALAAHVTRIEPYAHTKISALGVEEQRVNVLLRLDQPDAAPPLGHAFRVDVRVILSETDDAVRVPADALVRDGAGWSVWRVEGGRARRTPVDVAAGLGYRLVHSGVREGDVVVLFPGERLREGQRVKRRD